MKKVLIAMETQEIAEIVIEKLREFPVFQDFSQWQFAACWDPKNLAELEYLPDVLLISRGLLGKGLKLQVHNIAQKFAHQGVHVVFIVGELTEQARNFMKLAKRERIENFVMGTLPGDLPYTIDLAIQYPFRQITGYGGCNLNYYFELCADCSHCDNDQKSQKSSDTLIDENKKRSLFGFKKSS